MVLRTFAAWAIYQAVVFILYLPFKDEWTPGTETNEVIDALYFGSVTLSTVGYGDVLPITRETRLVTSFLIFFALSFVVFLLGELSSLLLSEMAEANAKALEEMGNKDSDGDGIPDKDENLLMSIIFSPRAVKFQTGLGIICVNLGLGIAVMCIWEDLDFSEALYFSMVTITTVGYGDFGFTREGTRLFASFWLLGAPVLTSFGLTSIVEAVFNTDGQMIKLRKATIHQATSKAALEEMDKDGDGKFSKEEFAAYVVKQLIAAKLAEEDANAFLADLIQNVKQSGKPLLD